MIGKFTSNVFDKFMSKLFGKISGLCMGVLFCGVASSVASSVGFAANGPFGLGIIVGNPTGISATYELSSANAVAGALAWHFYNGVQIQGDYLWKDLQLIKTSANPIGGYIGAGLRFQTWSGRWCGRSRVCDDSRGVGVGVRLPLGFEYALTPHPFHFFLEIVPTLDLIPATDLDLDVALGARFFF